MPQSRITYFDLHMYISKKIRAGSQLLMPVCLYTNYTVDPEFPEKPRVSETLTM